VIENWKEAKSKVGDDQRFYALEKHIGIFSMILFLKYDEGELELLVLALDGRVITLLFSQATLKLNS